MDTKNTPAIRAAVAPTYLGQVLVAATARGLCTIELGDDPHELLERQRQRCPQARGVLDDREFNDWIAQVVTYLDAPRGGLALPLDIQGTAFQRRVWEALRSIPAGTTRTYAWVAAKIGRPTAARAVARACATNSLAVAIPCHRVVRGDGHPSGYRWGIDRKRTLLERESRPTNE